MRIGFDAYELAVVDRIVIRKAYRYYWSNFGRDVAHYECTRLACELQTVNEGINDERNWQRTKWQATQ